MLKLIHINQCYFIANIFLVLHAEIYIIVFHMKTLINITKMLIFPKKRPQKWHIEVEPLSPPTFWYQRLVHRTIHEETLRRHLPGAAVVQPVRNRDHRPN